MHLENVWKMLYSFCASYKESYQHNLLNVFPWDTRETKRVIRSYIPHRAYQMSIFFILFTYFMSNPTKGIEISPTTFIHIIVPPTPLESIHSPSS